MATFNIELYVDESGNTRAVVDGDDAFDNLEADSAVRKVTLTIDVPEPVTQDVEVEVPAKADDPATVTVT